MSNLDQRRDSPRRRRFDHTKRSPSLGIAIVAVTAAGTFIGIIWAISELLGELL